MRSWHLHPVAYLTAVAAVLTAVTSATAAPPLDHLLSPSVTAWLGLATVVVTALLGAVVHGKVTPLVAPRDSEGRALIPANPAAPILAPPRGFEGAHRGVTLDNNVVVTPSPSAPTEPAMPPSTEPPKL